MNEPKKPYIDNSGFKELIEADNKKKNKKVDDQIIDLLPFIEFEMGRIDKITKLFSKLKQHQLYPHLNGLIRSERKDNQNLYNNISENLKRSDSRLLKNLEFIIRENY